MPIYEYRCSKCNKVFEVFKTCVFKHANCPTCGNKGEKIFSTFRFNMQNWRDKMRYDRLAHGTPDE